jgi:hypothetical protein
MSEQATLRRVQVREILHRHRGSINEIAAAIGTTSSAVGMWLGGRTKSKRVAEAATRKAKQLLEQERTAAEDTNAHELKKTA